MGCRPPGVLAAWDEAGCAAPEEDPTLWLTAATTTITTTTSSLCAVNMGDAVSLTCRAEWESEGKQVFDGDAQPITWMGKQM